MLFFLVISMVPIGFDRDMKKLLFPYFFILSLNVLIFFFAALNPAWF